MRAIKVSRLIGSFFLWSVIAGSSACSEPQCPPGYRQQGDTCYRIKDAGQDAAGTQQNKEDGGRGAGPDEGEGGDGIATMGSTVTTGGGADSGPKVEDASTTSVDAARDDASTDASIVADTSVPEPIDPCRGMTGCVACTADNQCPDPGACLVRRCNTTKSICEPSFSPAETSCGASKCDGAGNCVGCLSDNDCGNPGECKTRYCNPSTRVCEPRNAPTTTACPAGHCDQGVCVQCSNASECTDRTCQTKGCQSGQCRYSNVPAGQPGTCPSGNVCTSAQLCRECETDAQCNHEDGACTEGRCMNNACRAVPKTGSCGSLKMCTSSGACEDSCNNGVIDTQAGEQCDPRAAGSNSWTCDRETCARTGLAAASATTASSYRRVCGSDTDCATNEMCVVQQWIAGIFSRAPICVPKCDNGQCRRVSGYSLTAPVNACTDGCLVTCSTNADCPPGVECRLGIAAVGYCAGPFY
jgi:hypothetical protein